MTAAAQLAGPSSRAGHPVAAKDHSQGRTFSLRCGRSTLTVISPGKISAYREDGKIWSILEAYGLQRVAQLGYGHDVQDPIGAQHAAYADALAASGWTIQQVPVAEDCPDSVFIKDKVVVCEDLAVLARPGAPARRAEVAGAAGAVRSLGLRTAAIREPGTLDGGDVLQAGRTVYVGRGGRTNGAGVRPRRLA
jgi:arginine deiminase